MMIHQERAKSQNREIKKLVQHLAWEVKKLDKEDFKYNDETDDDVEDNVNEDFTFEVLEKDRLLEEYGKKKQRMNKIVTNN